MPEMGLGQLAAFLGVSLVVIVTPGQDTALTVRNTLTGGRGGGVLTALGVVTGQLTWALAASAGLSALLLACGNHHFGALPGEHPRGGTANSGASAGNNYNFAFEIHGRSSVPSKKSLRASNIPRNFSEIRVFVGLSIGVADADVIIQQAQ